MNKIRKMIIISTSIIIFFLIIFWLITMLYIKKNFVKKESILYTKKNNLPLLQVDQEKNKFDDEELNTIKIYEKLNSSVVNITYKKTEYIRYFFDIYPQTSEGQGSGAIIDKKGYIITNYHVVGDADQLTVALSQEEEVYEAEIVGVDPENDLAVIKIKNPKEDLNIIPLGTSSNLKIGQKVYAIGNPFGLDRTLTAGIISAIGRPIKTKSGTVIEGAIQTDASINPGNSGGPLIDSSGKMIGINTMIISPSGGSVGVGFAIPIDTVKDIVNEIIKYGYVKRGWIDATFLPITPSIAKTLGYKVNYGLMIMQVAFNGEAYKAGLRGGDEKALYGNKIVYVGGEILVAVDNVKIKDYSSLSNILKNKKPGQVVDIEYYKKNKKYKTTIKLIDKRNFSNIEY